MAQVVGDRTGHASDGCELFRFQQIALALQQAGPHAIEGPRELRNLVAPAGIQGMMKVS